MKNMLLATILFISSVLSYSCNSFSKKPVVSGENKIWHSLSLTFDGPETSETDQNNPFLNYRLDVIFKHDETGKQYLIPGFYAADGDAANTSAETGNKWRVYFTPDETGIWNYAVIFKKGENVAVSDSYDEFEGGGHMDGYKGEFTIKETDKLYPDFRARGRLEYIGERYLKFAGNNEYFLKAGVDAPENMLAYIDFDGNFKNDGHKDDLVKTWEPHLKDWNEGDPTWQENKGKGLIGAINYLASEDLNAMSFLTLNIEGDDRNVFPYISYDERKRMDVSRLSQWEIVFKHAQESGIFLHFKTQEAENQKLLDNGDLGPERKLYYRELIARFGHHLALNWNLGEENGSWGKIKGQNAEQRRAMAQYFHNNDPYHHHIVIHNGEWFDDLYGDRSALTGVSLQTHRPDFSKVHPLTLKVLEQSEDAGKVWAVACDEPGDAQHALVPDDEDPGHDLARQNALWGVLTAGGWGIEWYFGYKHDHSDLTCQDWRSRDKMWDQCRYALQFFDQYEIPFWNMSHADSISFTNDWVLASKGEKEHFHAIVYNKDGGDCEIKLPEGSFNFGWFKPSSGDGLDELIDKGMVNNEGKNTFSAPDEKDWILLITPKNE